MSSISFETSVFRNIKNPISINDIEKFADIFITNCYFILCSSGAVSCHIFSGCISLTNVSIQECVSQTFYYGLNITNQKYNLCSINQFSACGCVSINKDTSFGSYITSESLVANSNFSDNKSKHEPSIRIEGNNNHQTILMYTSIVNCECYKDTVCSATGSDSIIRSIYMSNFTVAISPFYLHRTTGASIKNSNFDKGNINSVIAGNGSISACWLHESVSCQGTFTKTNLLSDPTNNYVIPAGFLKIQSKKNLIFLRRVIGLSLLLCQFTY